GGADTTGTTSVSSSHTNSSVVASTSAAGPMQASSSSGAPCNPGLHCGQVLAPNGNPQLLCPGSLSYNLYQALLKCTCGGKCAASCSANMCISQPATMNCITCEKDPGKGCGMELQACNNDL